MNNYKGLWYFAHPYTCKDKDGNYIQAGEEANFRLCCWRSSRLLLAGYNIYSPIAHTHPIHMACPEFLARQEHEMWYQLDIDFISRTSFTGIILAPGWKESKGCVLEKEWFEDHDRRILTYEEAVDKETK
uniref:DUF1937 domain-containing protein n=1 Tax=viral metagenome TaxID=1070528 RepID=A0A6M3JWF8_9ZZZZ